jgi:hypothetical protein
MDFGAVGNGTADDTAAVQAAMNAAAGSTLYLGKHIYAINATGITCNNMVRVVGAESGQSGGATVATNFSGFVPMTVNQTVFKIAAGCFGSSFEDFYVGMSQPGANTSGWAFQTTATPIGNLRFQRLQIQGACGGIDISGYYWFIDQVTMFDASGAACIGIRVGHLTTGGATTGHVSRSYIKSLTTAARLGIGMLIEDSGGSHFSQNDILFSNRGTSILPQANQQVIWSFFENTVLGDTTQDVPLFIDTGAASAIVRGLQCNGCWMSSSVTSHNLAINNTGAATAFSGFHFVGARIYQAALHGVLLGGGKDIDFESSHVCGNSVTAGNAGIVVGLNVNNVRIRGGAVGGSCDGFATTQANGILVPNATNTNLLIQGVDVSQGNSTPISYPAGVTGRVEGNPGFNPLGPSAVTVTASPFTYTAGLTPESVCITGGTVSGVTIGGLTVAAATNSCVQLAPRQAMVATYSSLPVMVASKQ